MGIYARRDNIDDSTILEMTEVLEVLETSMKEVLGSYYRGKLEEQEC